MTLDRKRAEALLALQDKATPGDWVVMADGCIRAHPAPGIPSPGIYGVRVYGNGSELEFSQQAANLNLAAAAHDIANQLRAALAELDAKQAEIENLKHDLHRYMERDSMHLAELAAKQARIDELMLEYCPDEMTPEQVQRWKEAQERASD